MNQAKSIKKMKALQALPFLHVRQDMSARVPIAWRASLFIGGNMFKLNTPPNVTTSKEICGEYIDSDGITWEYKTVVFLSYNRWDRRNEVESVRWVCIEGFDIHDEPVKLSRLTKGILEGIEEHAGNLALEKVESADFDAECERE